MYRNDLGSLYRGVQGPGIVPFLGAEGPDNSQQINSYYNQAWAALGNRRSFQVFTLANGTISQQQVDAFAARAKSIWQGLAAAGKVSDSWRQWAEFYADLGAVLMFAAPDPSEAASDLAYRAEKDAANAANEASGLRALRREALAAMGRAAREEAERVESEQAAWEAIHTAMSYASGAVLLEKVQEKWAEVRGLWTDYQEQRALLRDLLGGEGLSAEDAQRSGLVSSAMGSLDAILPGREEGLGGWQLVAGIVAFAAAMGILAYLAATIRGWWDADYRRYQTEMAAVQARYRDEVAAVNADPALTPEQKREEIARVSDKYAAQQAGLKPPAAPISPGALGAGMIGLLAVAGLALVLTMGRK